MLYLLLLRAVICSGRGYCSFASVFLALLLCLAGLLTTEQLFNVRQDAGEADIHTLDYIRQLNVILAFFRLLLDVVARAGVVTEANDPGKPVKTVTNSDIYRLSKYPVPVVNKQ